MTFAYAARASVWPGQNLVLHVATQATRFRVVLYRWLQNLVHVVTGPWTDGVHASHGHPAVDWKWPAHSVPIPHDFPSGVYIAHIEEACAGPPHIAMQHGAALFVVRGNSSKRLLYKIPLATYNAYNFSGGSCLYFNPPAWHDPPGARLTFRRPGVGIGGPVFGARDYYDAGSPRQTFAHWDARFVSWLYANDYDPVFCTDLDWHSDPASCNQCRLLLSAGHDEYWSEAMRDHVEEYVSKGGNAAFFSGNVCWWRIHLVDQESAMVCHQGGRSGAHDHWWPATGVHRPEDSLSGQSYRHGGGWWDGPREATGYRVIDSGHWTFAGTDLRRGDLFGANTVPPLVGYECDGVPLASGNAEAAFPGLHASASECGMPERLHVLAWAPLNGEWQERPAREDILRDSPMHAAAMTIFRRGGTVFAAGTTDWAQVLAGGDPVVSRITANVLDGLLQDDADGSVP